MDQRFLFSAFIIGQLMLGCDDPADSSTEGVEPSPTVSELCEAVVRCTSPDAEASCRETQQAQLDDATDFDCVATRNSFARCLIDGLAPSGASGACSASSTCDVEYRAFVECVRSHEGAVDFACQFDTMPGSLCVGYEGVLPSSMTACGEQTGTILSACPEENLLGTCESPLFGLGARAYYYGDVALAASYMRSCENGGGAWTAQ